LLNKYKMGHLEGNFTPVLCTRFFKTVPSCSRDVEHYHQDTCSWTDAIEEISPLPGSKEEQKRARNKQEKAVVDRNRK
jgi:hypothetical protein